MQLYITRLTCLAVFAGVLAVVAHSAEIKITASECCTQSSKTIISAPIIGFRLQRKAPPCIRAIIFETTQGEVCSHWKESWVMEKVKELEMARRARNAVLASSTSSPTSSLNSSPTSGSDSSPTSGSTFSQ